MLLRLEFWVLKEAGEDAEELFLQILDARIGTYLHWRMNNEQNGPFLRTVKCLICSFEVDFLRTFIGVVVVFCVKPLFRFFMHIRIQNRHFGHWKISLIRSESWTFVVHICLQIKNVCWTELFVLIQFTREINSKNQNKHHHQFTVKNEVWILVKNSPFSKVRFSQRICWKLSHWVK